MGIRFRQAGMNDRDGFEGCACFRKLKDDTAASTIAESKEPVGVNIRRREENVQSYATKIARIRPSSANKGIVRASIASGLPKKVCPP